MEKLSKNIHNHTFTELIKVCIFALMLLLPGIIFLPSCLYYGFNEHATNTETTTINYKYESNEVNTLDDLKEGNIYHLEFENHTLDELLIGNSENSFFDLSFINITSFNFSNYTFSLDDFNTFFNQNSNFQLKLHIYDFWHCNYLCMFDDNFSFNFGIIEETLDSDTFTLVGDFIYDGSNDIDIEDGFITYTDYNVIESVSVNTDDTISTKLYKSWEQMWNTQLFSWTNNTPLNTGINGFIGVFGINRQSYIGNVLIWLLSITAIYVVIDIVIGVFKWLTHLIGNH